MTTKSEKTLTVVTFEPDTIVLYINGEYYSRGDPYMEGEMLRDIIESDIEIDRCRTDHFHFDRWEGTPDTLEECEKMYGDK